jgi:hypothetical protein
MTTPELDTLKPAVAQAIAEIRSQFTGHIIEVFADDDGGAFVKVFGCELGESYEPALSWVGFRITFQYPQADVYPHFLIATLRRRDGRALGEAFNTNQTWQPTDQKAEAAVMVSRRSNRLNPATDTAVLKLLKVLDWIRSR